MRRRPARYVGSGRSFQAGAAEPHGRPRAGQCARWSGRRSNSNAGQLVMVSRPESVVTRADSIGRCLCHVGGRASRPTIANLRAPSVDGSPGNARWAQSSSWAECWGGYPRTVCSHQISAPLVAGHSRLDVRRGRCQGKRMPGAPPRPGPTRASISWIEAQRAGRHRQRLEAPVRMRGPAIRGAVRGQSGPECTTLHPVASLLVEARMGCAYLRPETKGNAGDTPAAFTDCGRNVCRRMSCSRQRSQRS